MEPAGGPRLSLAPGTELRTRVTLDREYEVPRARMAFGDEQGQGPEGLELAISESFTASLLDRSPEGAEVRRPYRALEGRLEAR